MSGEAQGWGGRQAMGLVVVVVVGRRGGGGVSGGEKADVEAVGVEEDEQRARAGGNRGSGARVW